MMSTMRLLVLLVVTAAASAEHHGEAAEQDGEHLRQQMHCPEDMRSATCLLVVEKMIADMQAKGQDPFQAAGEGEGSGTSGEEPGEQEPQEPQPLPGQVEEGTDSPMDAGHEEGMLVTELPPAEPVTFNVEGGEGYDNQNHDPTEAPLPNHDSPRWIPPPHVTNSVHRHHYDYENA